MAVPTEAHRQFAADARATYLALVNEGFTDDQAAALVCCIVQPAAVVSRADRSARVAEMLDAAKKRTERPSPDDRAAGLWNPPASQGAPAHD